MTEREWEMCELLVTILLPFKKTSLILQRTTRPSIDEVFYTYESLFNKIDKLKATFSLPAYQDKEWAIQLHNAVEVMSVKLAKHYDRTAKPYVYPNSVILEPCGKLVLFKQETFEEHYQAEYNMACQDHYIKEYESALLQVDTSEPPAKKRRLIDVHTRGT